MDDLDAITPLMNEDGGPEPQFLLSVIIPARNEQDSLPACLDSLTSQSEPGFELGKQWELLLIDDRSTDATPRIVAEAARMEGVRVIEAPPLDESERTGFTGKTNACWAGAQAAEGTLLLFTDADTIHQPGDLSRARHELQKYKVAMLSYSPRQMTTGLLQRMVMPLVFAELAIVYPPNRVNAEGDRTAAANGQFLMVVAEDYFALGGHRAVGRNVLEDVALANIFKRSKRTIRFRYAPDALATRMYRTSAAMIEGWTKNLAILFKQPIPMALIGMLVFLLAVGLPLLSLSAWWLLSWQRTVLWVVWLRGIWGFLSRVSKSNFPWPDRFLALFGIPVFAWLLIRSYIAIKIKKSVSWKGRSYRT